MLHSFKSNEKPSIKEKYNIILNLSHMIIKSRNKTFYKLNF